MSIFKLFKSNLKNSHRYLSEALSLKSDLDPSQKSKQIVKKEVEYYFKDNPYFNTLKEKWPDKRFVKSESYAGTLYLMDPIIAKSVIGHISPYLKKDNNQFVCELSPGLGLISKEILEKGVHLHICEKQSEFKALLKNELIAFPNKELEHKNTLIRLTHLDLLDDGKRMQEKLAFVTPRDWKDEPAITIIETSTKINFIKFLIRCLASQYDIVAKGRIQLFSLMKASVYAVINAGPSNDLHTYRPLSVMFRLLFDYEIMEKYPRKAFLPWEIRKITSRTRSTHLVDPDHIYLVHINMKKDLPVQRKHLLLLYYFVCTGFRKQYSSVIALVEKLAPNSGVNVILPKLQHEEYFKDVDIFTKFGELTPNEILAVFKEMMHHHNKIDIDTFKSIMKTSHKRKQKVYEEKLAELV